MKQKEIDVSIERSIIIGLIISLEFTKQIFPILNIKYFKSKFTKIIARWCMDYYKKYEKVPGATITEIFQINSKQVQDDPTVELIEQFLESINNEYENSEGFNAKYWIEQAEKYFKKQKLEELKNKFEAAIESNDLSSAEKMITDFQDTTSSIKSIAIDEKFDKENFLARLKGKGDAIKTSWKISPDEYLTISPGALTFIASPTKHGKTTFLMNLFLDMLKNKTGKLHYFLSYEENDIAIILKMFSIYLGEELSRNNYKSLQEYFKTGNTQYFAEFQKNLKEKKEEFFDLLTQRSRICYANQSIEELKNSLSALTKKYESRNKDYHRVGVIFIDYLQMIPADESFTRTRHEQIKELCNTLKDIAVKHDLAIVIGTQTNRTVLKPEDLILQNLSEGSDIEKSANKVVGLWNFKKPGLRSKKEAADNKYSPYENKKLVMLKVLADRDGESGMENFYEADFNIKKIETEPIKKEVKIINKRKETY